MDCSILACLCLVKGTRVWAISLWGPLLGDAAECRLLQIAEHQVDAIAQSTQVHQQIVVHNQSWDR